MIAAFPDPYPDELLYSVCARYCERVGYRNLLRPVQELFGESVRHVGLDIPGHLGHLVNVLPRGHSLTVKDWIEKHTLFPFYRTFMPENRAIELEHDMAHETGPGVMRRAGLGKIRVPRPHCMRFCAQCVVDDRTQVGEPYWHRLHQIPGVLMCPTHGAFLEESNVPAWYRQSGRALVSAREAALRARALGAQTPRKGSQHLMNLAHDARWILGQSQLVPQPDQIRRRYVSVLIDQNLAYPTGKIKRRRLTEEMRDFYADEILEKLECSLTANTDTSWLFRLLAPNLTDVVRPPVHHLLLIRFLGHTVESFFQLSPEWHPFGVGPWKCFNPAVEHFRQPVIRDSRLVYSTSTGRKPYGIFSCSCGYSYASREPDHGPGGKRFFKVVSFGEAWQTRLRNLWCSSQHPISRLSQILGVGTWVLFREAQVLGLPAPRPNYTKGQFKNFPTPRERGRQLKLQRHREQDRKVWLEARKQRPTATYQMLANELGNVYERLRKNDREWLLQHRPPKPTVVRRKGPIMDWRSIDIQLARRVPEAAWSIRHEPGKPIRVTVNRICERLQCEFFTSRMLERLPHVYEALHQVTESREQHAVRRLHWAVETVQQRGQALTRSRLIQLISSRLYEKRVQYRHLLAAIDEVVEGRRISSGRRPTAA